MMTKQTARDVDWYQMVVTDKSGLTGTSVVEFVSSLVRRLGATAIGMSDLEGALPDLREYEGCVISSEDFLRKAADATQFDWAFLFLYVE
jgi:hypothetical protein